MTKLVTKGVHAMGGHSCEHKSDEIGESTERSKQTRTHTNRTLFKRIKAVDDFGSIGSKNS